MIFCKANSLFTLETGKTDCLNVLDKTFDKHLNSNSDLRNHPIKVNGQNHPIKVYGNEIRMSEKE